MREGIKNKNSHFVLAGESQAERMQTTSDIYNVSTVQDEEPGINQRISNYSVGTGGRPGSVYMDALTGLEDDEERKAINEIFSKQVGSKE